MAHHAETMQAEQKRLESRDQSAFADWLCSPEVRTLISALPPPENDTQRDTLQILLRYAFGAGAQLL